MKKAFLTLFVTLIFIAACGAQKKVTTAESYNPQLTKELVKAIHDCNPNAYEPNKENAFANCDKKKIRQLLKKGANPNGAVHEADQSAPLIFENDIPEEVYSLLIESGANADIQFVYYEYSDNNDKGVDVKGNVLIASMMLPCPLSDEYDHGRDNRYANINLLAQKVSNINEADSDGCTALFRCVESMIEKSACTMELINILVKNGADPTIKNSDGKSALSLLCRESYYSLDNRYSLGAKKAITETFGLSLRECEQYNKGEEK